MKLKTKKAVIAEHPDYKNLINNVISNIGLDSVSDVVEHGIDGGFSGFITYTDTHAFAMKHRKAIKNLLQESADDQGIDIPEMVSYFNIFKTCPLELEDKPMLYNYIGGGKCEIGPITNIMAWFAAEEVCRWFEDEED